MSSLAETARQEGDDAEAAEEEETPTEPTEPTEPEPEPAPEPPASQMTEQEAEREFKKLEKLAETYLPKALALTEKLGIPAQACPLCTFPGLAIPRSENEVTSDVEAAVLGMIGREPQPKLRRSEAYQRCPECDGWGEVDTDAQKAISRAAVCPNPLCGGKGYVTVSLDRRPATSANGYPGAEIPHTPLPQGIPDAWGRPAGHVHWGIDPAAVGV
jgi:pyruvate/2-oxoglutarate dehydrogenase complex dihydrolipoamide acyltransferase (E2) component